MYDIIGDIHGYAGELKSLLKQLGYKRRGGSYSHPSRKVVFVGDFIDRGPRILETLQIVRAMVESGSAQAVMGNHEFNAIAFHTEDPKRSGEYLREHSDKNVGQHQETMRQVSCKALEEYLEWFKKLPVQLDLGELRVVHACWDSDNLVTIDRSVQQFGAFTTEFMLEATRQETPLYEAVERVLKGPEIRLPKGLAVPDKEGHLRREMRIRWFEVPDGRTYGAYALPRFRGPDKPKVAKKAALAAKPYPTDGPPVFFGHYWLRAKQPRPLARNVACVDYSVAKKGKLCAYRWNGGDKLTADNFTWVHTIR